jgi:DNA-directed RNA polymerase subunit alpha
MEKFLKYDINVIKEDESSNYGKYTISPLERGFGITLGNALRRVMLSSVQGASAFAIRINGITHEYQSIPGAQEDVTQIILNIKELVIKIDENVYSEDELSSLTIEKWPVLKISSKKGVVKASDIECPAGFHIVNKDLTIVTLDDKNSFDLEIYATVGRGFKSYIENSEFVSAIGLIAIDSNFSPILKVSYNVNEIKTTKKGISDKLIIEVATNGSISPSDTIALAAKILHAHLEDLTVLSERISEMQVMKEKEKEERISALSVPIEDLNITMRSYNGLKRAGIQTIQELTNKTRDEINKIRNLGKKSIKEINIKLAERGLKFRD